MKLRESVFIKILQILNFRWNLRTKGIWNFLLKASLIRTGHSRSAQILMSYLRLIWYVRELRRSTMLHMEMTNICQEVHLNLLRFTKFLRGHFILLSKNSLPNCLMKIVE